MKNLNQNRRKISSIFLSAYLAFVITNAIHFHAYSFFEDPAINEYSNLNSISNHFLAGSFAFCAIHYFTGTILDLKFSSGNFSPFLNEREELKPVLSDRLSSYFYLSKNSPRAPPVFS